MSMRRAVVRSLSTSGPLPYGDLEHQFGVGVKEELIASCRDGSTFYFYDVLKWVRDRVWGQIAWIAHGNYDISSPKALKQHLAALTDDQCQRLRRKLASLPSNVAEFGEWNYRIFHVADDLKAVKPRYEDYFSEQGTVKLVYKWRGRPADNMMPWLRIPPLPLNFLSLSPAQRKVLLATLGKIEDLYNRNKQRTPFSYYGIWPGRRIKLRYFHIPSSPEILSLQAANGARCFHEAEAVRSAAKEEDLEMALSPWLPAETKYEAN